MGVKKPQSPAKVSALKQLEANPRLVDRSNRDVLSYIAAWTNSPTNFIQECLGLPSTQILHEGITWDAWVNEDYSLYATDEWVDLDTSTIGLEPALEALQWDMKISDQWIPRLEHKSLRAQGKIEGLKYQLDFPSLGESDLKNFVLDYCSGQLLCDHQIEASLVRMVFMPLALGAFSFEPKEGEEPSQASLAYEALSKSLGPEPVEPEKPPKPCKGDYPAKPSEPEEAPKPDPQMVEALEFDIKSEVVPPERLETYLEVIHLKGIEIRYHFEKALEEWTQACLLVDQDHEQDLLDWVVLCNEMAGGRAAFELELQKWSVAKAQVEALQEGFHEGYLDNIGVIYEQYSKASPRAINGQPTFFSFRVLNKPDWVRARKAIYREINHRESLEI